MADQAGHPGGKRVSPVALALSALHKTHSHARCFGGVARDLASEAGSTAPWDEAQVIVRGSGILLVAMRAPAVVICGAGEFSGAAPLRAIGKSARKIRSLV